MKVSDWNKEAKKNLAGVKILGAGFLNDDDFTRPLFAIAISEETCLYFLMDDEGNDAGVCLYNGIQIRKAMVKELIGRTIKSASYVKNEDYGYTFCMILDNGCVLTPMADEEGNYAGSIISSNNEIRFPQMKG